MGATSAPPLCEPQNIELVALFALGVVVALGGMALDRIAH